MESCNKPFDFSSSVASTALTRGSQQDSSHVSHYNRSESGSQVGQKGGGGGGSASGGGGGQGGGGGSDFGGSAGQPTGSNASGCGGVEARAGFAMSAGE